MLAPAVGREFEKARPAALADGCHGVAAGAVDADGVVAVAGRRGNAQGGDHLINLAAAGLAGAQGRINRVEVVFADEQDRELPERGEVGGFVEDALLHGAVAQKHDADLVRLVQRDRKAEADPDRDGAADDGRAALEADGLVDQVHRAALAGAAAGALAVNLSEHALKASAFGQIMRVGAMAADGEIVLAQGQAGAGADGLLPGRQMHRTAHFPFGVFRRDGLLDGAQALHSRQKIDFNAHA